MRRAGLGPTLALLLSLAGGAFVIALAVASAVIPPATIPPPIGGEQNQDTETALYLFTFGVLLPVGVLLVPRLADRIVAGPNGAGLSLLAAALAGGLALALAAARVVDLASPAESELIALIAATIWAILAAGLLARALSARPWGALLRLAPRAGWFWAAAGFLTLAAVVSLTAVGSLSLPALLVAALLAFCLAIVWRRLPDLPRPLGIAIDVAAVLLLVLAVPDLVVFRPEGAATDLGASIETGIIQWHHNLLLGPANQVLGGDAVLAETSSQYGAGPTYLIAAWHLLAPIGHGTFAMLDAILTALFFAAGYGVLRIAGVRRLLAVAAMTVAVVALVYNHVYPVGAIPQHGPIRFGLPMLVLLASVLGARFPGHAAAARGVSIGLVAISSVWSIEAFVFTAATFAGVALLESVTAPGGALRHLARQALLTAAACVAAHILFALATLAFAGELPEWGQYLAFLDEFLGRLGDLTYDVTPWAPGFAVGALIFASAAALVLVARRHPQELKRERVPAVALAGATAYAIVFFSYYVDRSGDHVLAYVSLPPLLVATIWISVLSRRSDVVPGRARLGLAGFGLAAAVVMIAAAWPVAEDRLPRSALAHALPGGDSFRDAIRRLWDPPPLDPRAPEGEEVLARHLPGEERVLILVPPDLGLEVLYRSGRSSELPFGDPWEDSFIAAEHYDPLLEAVEEIEPGSRLLIERGGLEVLAAGSRSRSIERPTGYDVIGGLAPLQQWTLLQIADRFRLVPIARTSGGLILVGLRPRPARLTG